MSGFNKVVLIGRLTADAELKYISNDTAVANFTLAVDRPFTNQQGGKETDFIRIVTWRKQAENVAQYLGKGSMAAIEGRLQTRSYEDRDGNKRTIAEVVADRVVFLDSKKSENTALDDYDNSDVPF